MNLWRVGLDRFSHPNQKFSFQSFYAYVRKTSLQKRRHIAVAAFVFLRSVCEGESPELSSIEVDAKHSSNTEEMILHVSQIIQTNF